MSRKKIVSICTVEGCDRETAARGLCHKHYMRWYLYKRTDRINSSGLRTHPLYHVWWDRKKARVLAPEWLNFPRFIADVGEKPKGHYFLVRLRGGEPLGPLNFQWQEHLKRKPGESKKAWYARKWSARQASNPSMERERTLRRRFGLSIAQYETMLEAQGGVCAVCGEPETTIDAKTGSLKRLSVDHCHRTQKIRALLCFRCNSTVGRLKENVELARKIMAYIEQHSEGLNA